MATWQSRTCDACSLAQANAALATRMQGELQSAEEGWRERHGERLEAERRERIAYLQQRAARRSANRDIAMGFSAWQEQWEEAARQKRMLAAAAGRLARPALAAAVAHWVGDWRLMADQKRLEAMSNQERRQMAKEVSLHEELAALREELEASREEIAATAAERAEEASSMEAACSMQVAEHLEAEREERVKHLQQQAARRIANAGIASGFTTWQGHWEEAARQKRVLAAAGRRLARPSLAAAVAHWRQDWVADEKAQDKAALAASTGSERETLQARAIAMDTCTRPRHA